MMNAENQETAVTTDRKYLLERVGEAAVVQLYADGFEHLPLKDKILCWHLYQAALAGRDIYYDQRYAHNLEMRALLEAIVTHADGVDPATLDAIIALHQAVLDQHRRRSTTSPPGSSCRTARRRPLPPRSASPSPTARRFPPLPASASTTC